MWATLIFGGTAGLFLVWMLSALWHLRWAQRLPSLEALGAAPQRAGTIRCSVVIAARDEEARIEPTIRLLLAQREAEVELIVVDDRSMDRTGEIPRRLAKEDSRLQVKRVDVLPDGWLGKCHACHVGASAATGDWILFTDADCWLKPDVVARAVRLAERDGVDHVTLGPGTILESPAARAWYVLFLISFLNWFAGVNRNRPKSFLGFGSFNLVRATAYRQCGGYEALRLTVVDDVKFGLLVRRAGKNTRAFLGLDDVECHWGATVGSLIRVMEKNYFAVVNFQIGLVLAGSAFALLMLAVLLAGLFSATPAGLAAALSPFLLVLPAGMLARRVGWSWSCAILTPFMIPVFLYALLNSTFKTLRQGGIRWRDTFYPLKALRAGNLR